MSPDKVEVRSIHLDLKEHTMTTATMALAELAEKGADVDVLRQMVQFMAQRLMELDVEGRCGAGYDEKSTERINSRNGYRERSWDTRAGNRARLAIFGSSFRGAKSLQAGGAQECAVTAPEGRTA